MVEDNEVKYQGWEEMVPKLQPEVVETIKDKLQFSRVTKTQAAVVPLFLSNKDVCVKAATGSGKTLAFGIPVIETLLKFCQQNARVPDSDDDDDDENKEDVGGVAVSKD